MDAFRRGPLTEFQTKVMADVLAGKSRATIAAETGKSVTWVTTNVRAVVAKLGASSTYHAVAMMARAQAYREAATYLEEYRDDTYNSDGILTDLAIALRGKALIMEETR